MLRWLWNKMMKWGWDFNRDKRGNRLGRGEDMPVPINNQRLQGEPDVRIAVWTAMNGKVLELSKQSNSPHHNIDFRTMIVPDGEPISDTVALLLLAEGIK